MWRSRWARCALAAILVLTLPAAAQDESVDEEPTVAEEGVEEAAAESAEAGAAAETLEEGEPDAEDDAADADDEDSDSDSDADKPGLLIFVTDAESFVYVDGLLAGEVVPGESLEYPVDLGELAVRAISTEFPAAIWDKVVDLEEAGSLSVRIRMKRAIGKFQREERKGGIYRDPKHLLMWPKRDSGIDLDLREAYAYCRDLKTGGFENWRLPLLDELESLQAIWETGSYKIVGGILLSECCVWSSEYDGSERAWTFNYRFRKAFETNAGYELGLRALCVREWDPEAEAKAGADSERDSAADPADDG